MTTFLSMLAIILTPLVPLLLPGIALFARPQTESLLAQGTKVLTVSLTSHILLLTLAALLGMSSLWVLLGLLIITIGLLWRWRRHIHLEYFLWKCLSLITPLLVICLLFAAPYLLNQEGLPTGDIQKSIFWAQEINATNQLPNYSRAITHLNRDPVDFYTPGLHALTAVILKLSPQPLISIGLFAILLAAAASWITIATTKLLFPNIHALTYALVPLFLLTNIRFLRYLREPGYHFQNLAGEVLLFMFLYFALQLIISPQNLRQRFFLTITTGLSLLITHQFSAFIAAFIAIPILLAAIYHFRRVITSWLQRPLTPILGTIVIGLLLTVGTMLDLHLKLPHIFSSDPHLLPLTPNLANYPNLLGPIWIFLALIGLIGVLHQAITRRSLQLLTFSGVVITFLLLSQGPRLGIDIPPVRALFYFAIPGSLLAAYAAARLWSSLSTLTSPASRITLRGMLLVTILFSASSSLTSAYAGSNPDVRTNSTLTAPEATLIDHLATTDLNQAVLVDDYNQRSGSWLLLSQKPTFSRLASDLSRIMDEARQSPKRYQLYLQHLDYEKIFSLASRPESIHLLTKHSISHVTGVTNTSLTGFASNPALTPTVAGDRIQLFTPNSTATLPDCPQGSLCHWLLHTSTLVNDIGDTEDTFAHLPASLRSTRLSDPQISNTTTYRTTSAPIVPLAFNVGDYTQALIDQDGDFTPDNALQLQVLFTAPPTNSLTVTTPDGQTHPFTPGEPLRLPARSLPISTDGFITITLNNPQQQPLEIDLIALGLSALP